MEVQEARVAQQHLGPERWRLRCRSSGEFILTSTVILDVSRHSHAPPESLPNPLADVLRSPVLQFSLAFYVMLDSAVWSKSAKNGSNVHVKFVDWLPLIFSSLGMLIINSVEKQRLSADSFSYSGSGVAWKARVVLFLGFAALAGGMAGGVTVFVLKFVVPGVGMPALSMGIENLVSNALVGFRYVQTVPPYGRPLAEGRSLITNGIIVPPALSFCGLARTWRTSTPTTSHCNRLDLVLRAKRGERLSAYVFGSRA